jgi:hypothetical protein
MASNALWGHVYGRLRRQAGLRSATRRFCSVWACGGLDWGGAGRESLPRLSQACLNQRKRPESLGFRAGGGPGDGHRGATAGEGMSERRQAMAHDGVPTPQLHPVLVDVDAGAAGAIEPRGTR